MISIDRILDIGRAQGGHIWRDKHGVELGVQCEQQVAAVRLTVTEGVNFLTHDQAVELGQALIDVACDG